MKAAVLLLILTSLLARPIPAADWTFGLGGGAFFWGDFVERHATISNEFETIEQVTTLSAATRPGVALSLDRSLSERLAFRFEGKASRSPLAIKSGSSSSDPNGESVSLRIGDMNVYTMALAAKWRFNRGGALRPYLFAGPAWAIYQVERNEESGAIPIFEGSRGRLGLLGGAGLEWWLSRRMAVRGEVSDVYTESPIELEDFGAPVPRERLEINRPHNIHTTLGLAWRF
jgi:opacity protein-like surface antigen